MLGAKLAVTPARPEVLLGVGDDAAVLRLPHDAVVTTDLLLDSIDFTIAECGYARAGAKAMNKNLSDLAAMGALPVAAFVSVALPPGIERGDASALLDGLFRAADSAQCAIAGGDTKRSPSGLVVNVLVIGRPSGDSLLRRAGARVGDVWVVTGPLGGASLGHHLDFVPRLQEGAALVHHGATSAIDLSDGLARDLRLICAANGVGAVLDADAIPLSPDARLLSVTSGRPPLEHALLDGEDYELLATLPRDRVIGALADPRLAAVRVIGEVVAADDGITLRRGGEPVPLPHGGFRHRFGGDPS